jgi:2-C-methyl-D-erythritol 4-phosphate cytidylyltransferase
MKTLRYAILVAGGSGTRMGAEIPKQFLQLADGTPILVQTFRRFAAVPNISIIVVLPQNQIGYWETLVKQYQLIDHLTVAGGATRTDSVAAGMLFIPDDALVAIHDGVRPYITPAIVETSFATAQLSGAACTVVPCKDSMRQRVGLGSKAVHREDFFLVQTPQTFVAGIWKVSREKATPDTLFTDDASMVEAAGYPITLVDGSYANIKITTPDDMGNRY